MVYEKVLQNEEGLHGKMVSLLETIALVVSGKMMEDGVEGKIRQ